MCITGRSITERTLSFVGVQYGKITFWLPNFIVQYSINVIQIYKICNTQWGINHIRHTKCEIRIAVILTLYYTIWNTERSITAIRLPKYAIRSEVFLLSVFKNVQYWARHLLPLFPTIWRTEWSMTDLRIP